MSRSNDLAFMRLLCTSGVDLIAQMPLASEYLRRLVPAFSLSMIRVDAHCAPQEHYSEFFDEYSHQLFATAGHVFAARSEDPASFGNLLRGPRAYGNLIETPPAYLQGATYQVMFQRNGIHHCLDVALRDSGGPLGILGIFREREAPPFTRADVAVIDALYPLLVHACAAKPTATEVDEVDSAMMIVSLDGRIQWASAQAANWLQQASFGPDRGALVEQQQLPAACRELCRMWQTARAPQRSAGPMPPAPTLTLRIVGGQLRLRAYSLSGQPDGGRTAPAYIGIQLSLEMDRNLRVLRALSSIRLTPQQRRIAYGLWQGQSANEIGAALGLSTSTLKSYQKELYGRLDVNGVTELRSKLEAHANAATLDLTRHLPKAH